MRFSWMIAWAVAVPWPRGAWAQETFAPPAEPPRLQAMRAHIPVLVDGRLDDAAWDAAPWLDGFRQIDPKQLAPATLRTAVRVLFDERYLYVGAFMADSGAKRARDLRRDFAIDESDYFGVSLDPFGDARTAVGFLTNPYGAQRDLQVFDDNSSGRWDVDFDAAWTVRTRISDSGWAAEMSIPWSSLRYPRDRTEWRINFHRLARRLFESSAWSPWPRAFSPYRMAYSGVLTGLEVPPP